MGDELPEHLRRRPDGSLECRACHNGITIGETGLEYGHQRFNRSEHGVTGRCPHRPDAVDPNTPTEWPEAVAMDEDGQFVSTEGGESA